MSIKTSYDDLLNLFITGVEKTRNVDYSNKASVRRNNMGNSQYRKAAAQIGKMFPERISDFSTLLTSEKEYLRLCCAACMVELMNCPKELSDMAIAVVREHLNNTTDAIEQFGWSVWLERNSKTRED